MRQHDIVYRISCNDCDASLARQKGKTRIAEHSSDINKKSSSPSVISNHRISLNHNFDWKKVKILDREPSYNKRLTSEMIFIKRMTKEWT